MIISQSDNKSKGILGANLLFALQTPIGMGGRRLADFGLGLLVSSAVCLGTYNTSTVPGRPDGVRIICQIKVMLCSCNKEATSPRAFVVSLFSANFQIPSESLLDAQRTQIVVCFNLCLIYASQQQSNVSRRAKKIHKMQTDLLTHRW